MQEEVENRTVNLAISTTKLTARSIVRLGLKGIAYIKRKSQEAALKNEKPTGKQTIQKLIGQNQGVTNIDISKTDLKGFEKYARKYGVDYAITKDKLNRLENRKKYLEKGERQKRTHRLCNLGGTIESLAPEVKDLTRTEMTELMEHIFSLSEVQRAVRHMAITHISQANREKELKADGTISSERHAD